MHDYKPTPADVQEAQDLLDSLVADGVAWKGDDGRYRLREDMEMVSVGDDEIIARRKPAN